MFGVRKIILAMFKDESLACRGWSREDLDGRGRPPRSLGLMTLVTEDDTRACLRSNC